MKRLTLLFVYCLVFFSPISVSAQRHEIHDENFRSLISPSSIPKSSAFSPGEVE